ncbi:MAG: helix-turn-helix domain-containing protein [Schlesneria sp.]
MSKSRIDTALECLATDAAGVAKLLNVSVRHVNALNASGRLPKPIRLGRSVRWQVAEVRAWLNAGAPNREAWEASKSEA